MEDEDAPKPKRPPPDTKEQQHNRPWSFKRFFSSNTEHKNKEYWQNLPLDEKRKQYRCREKYLTLEQIPTWPDFYSKTKCTPAVGDSKYPLNPTLNNKVSIWQGDITRLEIDAIVNAANSSLMGGGGVDGAIHSAAGSSLRDECRELNGCETGDAKITTGHRLPAKFIIHTVGPMNSNAKDLQSCYTRCLQLVLERNIKSVAFCCISTGIYGFPNDKAANIALETVRQWLETGGNAEQIDRIIFTVFLKEDYKLYMALLHHYFPLEENVVSKDDDTTEEKKEEEFKPKLVKYATEPMTYRPSNEANTDKGELKGVTQMETDERGVESNQIDNAGVESNQTENMEAESNQTDNTGVEPNQMDNDNIDSNQKDNKGEDRTVNGIEAENDKKVLDETDNKGVTPNEQTQDEDNLV